MKERKIILVLTLLFGLALALRVGYEEVLRHTEPAPPRPRRAATTYPIRILKSGERPSTTVMYRPGHIPCTDDDLTDSCPSQPQCAPVSPVPDGGDRRGDDTPPGASQPGGNPPGGSPPAADSEPPAPPPVKPDGDKPPASPAPPPGKPPAGDAPPKEAGTLSLAGGGRLKLKERRLEIDGVLCKRDAKVLLELLACAPGGKEHESAFILKVPARELHTALLLMGLESGEDKGGGGPRFQGDPAKPVGDRIVIEVSWTLNGETTTYPAEDLLLDQLANAPMKRTGWTFTGSKMIDEVDVDTGRPTGRSFYVATRERSLVTVYHDPTTVLDNPMKNGGSDLVYVPRTEILPPVGTPVTFVFRPASADEMKTFEANEKAADAAWDAKFPPGSEPGKDDGSPPDGAQPPDPPHPPDFEGPLPGPKPEPEPTHPPDFEGPLPGPKPPEEEPESESPK